MADWVNNGSCQDLSDVLPGDPISVLAPTSQEGGNQQSSNELAMTAPGSQPVDILKDRETQVDPKIEPTNSTQIKPGTDGKPQPGNDHLPSAPSWGKTTAPSVVREK
jgi:hypothetical protein